MFDIKINSADQNDRFDYKIQIKKSAKDAKSIENFIRKWLIFSEGLSFIINKEIRIWNSY